MNSTNKALQGIPTRSVNEFMDDSSAGSFIMKNKGMIIGVVIFLLVATILGGLVYNHLTTKRDEHASLIYNFHETDLKSLNEGKLAEADFIGSYKNLLTNTKGASGVLLIGIEAFDQLMKKGKTNEALSILTETENALKSSNVLVGYLLGIRFAACYEDLGKSDEAIKYLERIVSSKIKLVEPKIYLDLGRLYIAKGENDKAKKSLQYVIDNYSGEDLTRVAKLFMEKLK